MKGRESKIEELIRDTLEKKEIYLFNLIYTFECGGLLSLTTYTGDDLEELKDIFNYRILCDKSGFTWYPESNTVLITGNALGGLIL